MKSSIKTAIIPALITAIIGPAIWFVLSSPDPVWNKSSDTDNICQKKLDFRDMISEFSFSFSNLGKDKGNFEATVSSNDVLLKYKDSNQDFTPKNSKVWVVAVGNPANFQFPVKLPSNTEAPENISLKIDLTCKRYIIFDIFVIPCGFESYTCNYQNQHTQDFDLDYELVK